MKFKEWLNLVEIGLPGRVKAPKKVADLWSKNVPTKQQSAAINRAQVKYFTGKMTDPNLNLHMIGMTLMGQAQGGHGVKVYDKPLEGGLILVQTGKLKNATGLVFFPSAQMSQPFFGFADRGPHEGSMAIECPTLVYDNADVLAMLGIIVHECRHAHDYAIGVIVNTTPIGQTANDYLNSLAEARAHTDQIITLIEELTRVLKIPFSSAVDAVEEIITNTQMPLNKKSMQVASHFLKLVRKQGDGNYRPNEAVAVAPRHRTQEVILREIVQHMKVFELFDARNFLQAVGRDKGIDPYGNIAAN